MVSRIYVMTSITPAPGSVTRMMISGAGEKNFSSRAPICVGSPARAIRSCAVAGKATHKSTIPMISQLYVMSWHDELDSVFLGEHRDNEIAHVLPVRIKSYACLVPPRRKCFSGDIESSSVHVKDRELLTA